MELLPPSARSHDVAKTTATIPGRAAIIVAEPQLSRLVPIRDEEKNLISGICAARAYSEIKKDAPEFSGRAINVYV